MNTAMHIIETRKLSCKAGYRYLLKDVDWTVHKGEHWLVFGMNGCGKTTLLSILAGFRAFTGGSLKVFGETYNADNVLGLRKKIGFISSSFFDKVLSRESVLDIVLAGKYGTVGLNALPENKDVIHAKALLRELHLKDKINRPFHLLSKGERQNVLIARALMGKPEMLILDEPGTGLDVFAREYMLSTVQDLAENTDMTIIYVTHYTEEILEIFDKCMLMRNGRILQLGETESLFTESNISDFLEYPVRIEQHGDRMQLRMDVQSRIREML
ncbi:MAG: ATP-binding cassette domain-containing protein [Peptococcaceae bacterium]|nr:ATP-binding cassette domain-containing protein [Peptococcaceae bacterium]